MKKLFLSLLCCLSFAIFNVSAEETEAPKQKVAVYIFSKDGCPHCTDVKDFMAEIEDDYGKYFNLVNYQVYDAEWVADEYYSNLMDAVAARFGGKEDGVPYIVIGKDYATTGFNEAIGEEMIEAIVKAYESDDYEDVVVEEITKLGVKTEPDHSADTWIVLGILVAVIGGGAVLICLSRKK